jgi:hypothetical protein
MNMIGPKSIKVPDCPSKILRPIPWYKGRVRPTCFSCCLNPDRHATWRVAMARRYIWIITRRAPEMLSSTSCTCAPMRSTLSLALGLLRLCSYPDIMEPTWYVTVRTYHDFMDLYGTSQWSSHGSAHYHFLSRLQIASNMKLLLLLHALKGKPTRAHTI